ncbi:hypothetical protein BSKO_02006 [Bryopsis sp. KO-2023]|nr:hypothetical protein BSKO_02006 [Bryopsis sp. KO-2023]
MKHSRYCKVYYSLLALSYLEVVLWSSCLLVSLVCAKPAGTTDTQHYILRETVNLKFVGGQDSDQLGELLDSQGEFDEGAGHCEVFLREAEKQRQQLEAPELSVEQFSGLRLTNLQIDQGLPAPYTGVKVIL